MVTSHHPIDHVRVETGKTFAEVTKDFERQLGKYDPTVFQAIRAAPPLAEGAESRIEAMAGPSGLMLFGTMDHGALLSLFGKRQKAVQYVVGNPLIAIQMTRHNLAAGLYAPLRVLIYEGDRGMTRLEYDLPSSLFGQFDDVNIAPVAHMLDRKLEELVAAAIG
ncbi:MAG: hypothetical protein JWO38_1163 [Gemmataceae bacterium]|nr:hypothetical protein [Gemmataceae bacterium]